MNGYFFLAKILMWTSIPLLATPWYVPFLKPLVEKYFIVNIETDYTLWIGVVCLTLGFLSAVYGIFKDKQIENDKQLRSYLNGILTETQMLNLFNYFKNNAHIEKSKLTSLNNYLSEINKESNKFSHPLIKMRAECFAKSVGELVSFTTTRLFDLHQQVTPYHYFLPDKNIDLSNSVSLEDQIEFDREFAELTNRLNLVQENYNKFISSMRRNI